MNSRLNGMLIVIAICFACPAFGAVNESSAQLEKPGKSFDDTSYDNRADQTVELTFQPVGFAVNLIPSFGLNAGFYATPDLIIEAQYSYGSVGIAGYNIGARTFAVGAKYFLANSFYVRGGLLERQITVEDDDCFFCSTSVQASNSPGYANTLAAEFAIGNQWQWDHFTLGCDWIGAMLPLAVLDKNEGYYANAAGTSYSTSQFNQVWQHADTAVSLEFLRFYLGASF